MDKGNLNISSFQDIYREFSMMIRGKPISLVVQSARRKFFKIEKVFTDVIFALKLFQSKMPELPILWLLVSKTSQIQL